MTLKSSIDFNSPDFRSHAYGLDRTSLKCDSKINRRPFGSHFSALKLSVQSLKHVSIQRVQSLRTKPGFNRVSQRLPCLFGVTCFRLNEGQVQECCRRVSASSRR